VPAITNEFPRLAGIEAFRGLTGEQYLELERRLKTIPVIGGTCLVTQGESATELFLVITGRFEVLIEGRSAPIAEIGAGSPIGEIGFFAGGARTASVKAQRDSLVLRLTRADFDDLVGQFPQMWTVIAATLARRLAITTAGVAPKRTPRPRTIAICQAGSVPLDETFLGNLRLVFERHANTVVLDASTWQSALHGLAPPASDPIDTTWFNELEAHHDYVIYVADAEVTEWSRKVVRQADLVLCVGQQTGTALAAQSQPNALEFFVAVHHRPENIRLILVHAQTGKAQGTRAWLDARSHVGLHHHVGRDHLGDYERLYRFISGSALGLVACGGGAFSAAHIGLYQAFLEAGLVFDIMGGTSGGAAITAAMALGSNPDEIERHTHDIFVTRKALGRWTVPRYSLLDHGELDRALRHHFTDIDIEDLWIPFYAISTNLSRNSAHCHLRGPLWHALRASCSIPALLPPVFTVDGDMLVDGCLTDNVPLKAMRGLKSGPNIVVDLLVPEPERGWVINGELPSRAALARAYLTPAGRKHLPKFPSPADVLVRSLMLNRANLADVLGPDDVLLEPRMPVGMSHLDWHRHSELRALAYTFACSELQVLAAKDHAVFRGRDERRTRGETLASVRNDPPCGVPQAPLMMQDRGAGN
jgi:NTE family protein